MSRAIDGSGHRERSEAAVARRAATRHGVISREEAFAAGMTEDAIEHRLRTGRWERMFLGVYRLAGSPPSWQQSLLSAALAGGPQAVASHRAAARLWRLPGFTADLVEITVPRSRQPRRRAEVVVHRVDLSRADVTTVGAIPATTAARTLLDIASVVSAEVVEIALDDGLRRGLFSVARLTWRLDEEARSGRPGSKLMRQVVSERAPGARAPESPFETLLFRLLKAAGLPTPVVQYEVLEGARVIARVDFAYPEIKLAIEADGFEHHAGRIRFESDRLRANELTARGWRIIRVTWAQMQRDPEAVVRVIGTALGWPGSASANPDRLAAPVGHGGSRP